MRYLSIIVFLAAVVFVSCNSSTSNNNKQTLIVSTTDATEIYQCPMKCQGDTAYTTLGQCPVCEMDLEKLK